MQRRVAISDGRSDIQRLIDLGEPNIAGQYLERNGREAGALLQGDTDKICQQHGGLKDQDIDHAHAFSQDTGVGIEQGRDGGEAGEQADGPGQSACGTTVYGDRDDGPHQPGNGQKLHVLPGGFVDGGEIRGPAGLTGPVVDKVQQVAEKQGKQHSRRLKGTAFPFFFH